MLFGYMLKVFMLFTSMLRPLYAVYLYAKALYDVLIKTLYVFGYMLKSLMLFT